MNKVFARAEAGWNPEKEGGGVVSDQWVISILPDHNNGKKEKVRQHTVFGQ